MKNFTSSPRRIKGVFRDGIRVISVSSSERGLTGVYIHHEDMPRSHHQLEETERTVRCSEELYYAKVEEEEHNRLRDRVRELERQLDHWRGLAAANVPDGLGEQLATVAMHQLWDILGAEHQTEAVVKARELVRRRKEPTRDDPGDWRTRAGYDA